jgi:HPt (histidine-containing phosphotransfer) domain-containing protein
MVANPQDHVDIDQLSELKDIMEDEFQTLIDTFIADSDLKIVGLQSAIVGADADEMRKVAHSLKGSSSNVCANRFSEFARQLEQMGKDGITQGAEAILEQLKAEFLIVQEVLNNQI